MAPTRFHWTDDDGSGTVGTVINDAELQRVLDYADAASGPAWAPQGIPYAAGNFAASGSSAWVVDAGDMLVNRWTRLTPTQVHWWFYLGGTSLLNAPASDLILQNLPFVLVANQVVRVGWAVGGGAPIDAFLQVEVQSNAVKLRLNSILQGGVWPTGVDHLTIALATVLETTPA